VTNEVCLCPIVWGRFSNICHRLVCVLCGYRWKLFWEEGWSWQWIRSRLSTWWNANYGCVVFPLYVCSFIHSCIFTYFWHRFWFCSHISINYYFNCHVTLFPQLQAYCNVTFWVCHCQTYNLLLFLTQSVTLTLSYTLSAAVESVKIGTARILIAEIRTVPIFWIFFHLCIIQ